MHIGLNNVITGLCDQFLDFYKEHINGEQCALYFHFKLRNTQDESINYLELIVTQSYEVFYKRQDQNFNFVVDGFIFESRHDTAYRSLRPVSRLTGKYELSRIQPNTFIKRVRVLTAQADDEGYKRNLVMMKECS